MSDNPIKFPSSPLSSEDDLPAHQSSKKDVSSDDWRPSYYSPPWSSEKEELRRRTRRTRTRTTPKMKTITPTLMMLVF
jgi:hypothetical protein